MSSKSAATNEEGQHNSLYLQFSFNEKMLTQPGVCVRISVLSHSPLMELHGARQVISFLESLPYPSVILITDSINKHNVMAIKGVPRKRKLGIDKAREIALERGNVYVAAISSAIKERKSVYETNKVTVIRWEDVMDENKIRQEAIVHEHYEKNKYFRERIEELAARYLSQRAPNSRYNAQRLSHAANFPLGEVPVHVTGVSYEGKRYQTHIYATSTFSLAKEKSNPDVRTFRELVNDIRNEPVFADLRKELVEADDGMEMNIGAAVLPISMNHGTC